MMTKEREARMIDLRDFQIGYQQFIDWLNETKVHVQGYGWTKETDWCFEFLDPEDLLAFKLKFKIRVWTSTMDMGYYYCPYIPDLTRKI